MTILMVVLNGAKYIHFALRSINRQTLKNIQLVIVDGGSTDDTLKLVEQFVFREGVDLVLIRHREERNIVHSYIRGLAEATAPYVFQLCCDDQLYDEDWLERGAKYLSENSLVDAVQCRSITVTPSQAIIACYPPLEHGALDKYDYLIYRLTFDLVLADSTVVYKRDVLIETFPPEGLPNCPSMIIPHTAADLNFLKGNYTCHFIDGIGHMALHHPDRRSNINRRVESEGGRSYKKARFKNLYYKIVEKDNYLNKTLTIKLIALLIISYFCHNSLFSSLYARLVKKVLPKLGLASR
jgi:glycosyltransferase involved in cell wall biosynthesis